MGDKLPDSDTKNFDETPSEIMIPVIDTEPENYDDEKNHSGCHDCNGCNDCTLGLGCCFWTHSFQLCCGCLPPINRTFHFIFK